MALRVTVTAAPDLTVIRVDGRLEGEGPGELERECRAARRPIVLDLTHLTSLDGAGGQLLRQLTGEGVHLIGASPYITMLLAVPAPAPARPRPRTTGALPARRRLLPGPPAYRRSSNKGVTPRGSRGGRRRPG